MASAAKNLKTLLKGKGHQIPLTIISKSFVSPDTMNLSLELPEGTVTGVPIGHHMRIL